MTTSLVLANNLVKEFSYIKKGYLNSSAMVKEISYIIDSYIKENEEELCEMYNEYYKDNDNLIDNDNDKKEYHGLSEPYEEEPLYDITFDLRNDIQIVLMGLKDKDSEISTNDDIHCRVAECIYTLLKVKYE
jgi:hypothetical protein